MFHFIMFSVSSVKINTEGHENYKVWILLSTYTTDYLINTEALLDIFIKFDHTFGKIAPYVLYTDDIKHLSLCPMSKLHNFSPQSNNF